MFTFKDMFFYQNVYSFQEKDYKSVYSIFISFRTARFNPLYCILYHALEMTKSSWLQAI